MKIEIILREDLKDSSEGIPLRYYTLSTPDLKNVPLEVNAFLSRDVLPKIHDLCWNELKKQKKANKK